MENPYRNCLNRFFMFLVGLGILIVLVRSLTSCKTPQEKLNKLYKENPTLFTNLKDTIHIHDTVHVTVPGTSIDTSFHVKSLQNDTVVIVKDHYHTEIYMKNDTIYVNGNCDTIYVSVPYEKIVEVPVLQANVQEKDNYNWLIFACIIFATFILMIALVKKK